MVLMNGIITLLRFNSLQVGYKQGRKLGLDLYYSAVSIPYRLATNLKKENGRIWLEPAFQFLIGWLQTYSKTSQQSLKIQSFNSLQVGYKHTMLYVFLGGVTYGFNSLQVGYKHGSGDARVQSVYVVSIPYRLATNLPCHVKPLQIIRFQFLIGWLQTIV